MILSDFLKNYGGNACISIDGYCEEYYFDFYALTKETWWNKIKNREIKTWNIIGGGGYPLELTITLK